MLKRVFFISVMAVVMAFAVAQMGMAYTVTTAAGFGPYQYDRGGEFSVAPDIALGALVLGNYDDPKTKNVPGFSGTFQTFCIEHLEFISPGTPYTAVLNSKAMMGGTATGDPISIGTAYLYSQFAAGTLAGYNWSNPGRSDTLGSSADVLQKAIWGLEDETTDPVGNVYYDLVVTMYGSGVTGAERDANGAFGVMALNLYDSNGGLAQDVLTVVPIPPAVFLLGSGFLGLVGIRRWRKK
jgi:hypothetical protein